MVTDSKGTRRYSPTVMTGEGKEETHKAMRLMLERGAPMLVTNPGTASLCELVVYCCCTPLHCCWRLYLILCGNFFCRRVHPTPETNFLDCLTCMY